MTLTRFKGPTISSGLTNRKREWNKINKPSSSLSLLNPSEFCKFRKELGYTDGARNCYLSAVHRNSLLSPLVANRNTRFPVFRNQLSSDFGVEDVDERLASNEEEDTALLGSTENVDAHEAIGTAVDVKRELIMLTLPAIAGQAIDPLTQLMETAYIGRLSSVALASAGESANGKPVVSIAERKQLSSVSTALLLAVLIGIFEALALSLGSGPFLKLMGVPSTSDMHAPAQQFLSLRALGAPAVVVSLALQGIFRGFKDTKTPVFCLGVGNLLAIFLFPLLMYGFGMGVTGAALSTVLSQYIVAFLMIKYLNMRVILLPPKMGALQFGSYIKSGGFLLGRTLAVLITMTLGTSMAARQGSLYMAAHQICMQVWLAVSLLTDALAASGQALIASYLSKGELKTVKEITNFVLKIGLVAGVLLAAILAVSFGSLATLFTQDAEVLGIVRTGVLFVSASQPMNALAFIFDGLHYGVSDFPYAACSMMLVGVMSSAILLFAPTVLGLQGVWLGLSLFMGLRMTAGFVRILSKTGPWWFLHREFERAELSSSQFWKKNHSTHLFFSLRIKIGDNLKITGGHQSPSERFWFLICSSELYSWHRKNLVDFPIGCCRYIRVHLQ
ncbi:protein DETOXIFICATION 45, chloroplastic-like isoform X2 [Durio zibethinus]|uniref:Protein DETOXIFICATION n=1 Tax=Durio zibethinus TaxID=66656 RepID=A0A6P5Z704_DURZI|nr:protein DETOXIFICATION 45, chloroplastic-like isoform X2 [Durio zibethinus]